MHHPEPLGITVSTDAAVAISRGRLPPIDAFICRISICHEVLTLHSPQKLADMGRKGQLVVVHKLVALYIRLV